LLPQIRYRSVTAAALFRGIILANNIAPSPHGKNEGMKFAATIEYTRDADKIGVARPAHREYLKKLLDSGNLAISGPFTDDSGGLLIYEADTWEQAEALIREDPFTKAGVFLSWNIRGWKPIMANPALFPA
jgi:uncharacterized protein YciI